MKIAIVYDVLYPERLGGGEKRNWEIARRLAARGHDVWLVSFKMWDGPAVITRDGVHCAGICRWNEKLFAEGRRSFMEPLYFGLHLLVYLLKNRFDVIDCGSFPYIPAISARIASMLGRGKLVITWYEVRGRERWIEHRGGMGGRIAAFLEKRVARLHAMHSAISEFTRRRAADVLGIQDMRVVPCGVDNSAAGQKGQGHRRSQVLYVGRLAGYKRVDLLVDAFSRVATAVPGATLMIVGRGECARGLREQAAGLGIADRVAFVESLSEDELRAAYSESKVFVLPSEQEGFGIVLVEAMASGTPVIAMDAPNSAAAELVVDGRNGLLAKDGRELAVALKLLLTDDALCCKLAAEGMRTARHFDWNGSVVPQQELLYAGLAG